MSLLMVLVMGELNFRIGCKKNKSPRAIIGTVAKIVVQMIKNY